MTDALTDLLLSTQGADKVHATAFPRRECEGDIIVVHEIARKNGMSPGHFPLTLLVLELLAALAYGLTFFVADGVALARLPAFAESLPSVPETAVAAVLTALAGLAGSALGCRATRATQTP